MRRFLIASISLLFFLVFTISSKAQQTDSLSMHKTFGSARFEYTRGDSVYVVSPKQVMQIMKEDPLALAEFQKAKSNYSASGVLGFIGGVMIGFPVGTAIAGGQPEWGLAAGGAVLVLIAAIPLDRAFKRHATTALDIYNKKHTAFRPRTNYYLSGLGAKIVIKF
jgi:hypothetical protein